MTHPRSPPSWPPSGFRAPTWDDLGPGRTRCSRTARTPPARSAPTCGAVTSGPSSRNPQTRSATASDVALRAAGHLPLTPSPTRNATPSSGASAAQAVARPGHANGQARHRLPGRTPPRRDPHLGSPIDGRQRSKTQCASEGQEPVPTCSTTLTVMRIGSVSSPGRHADITPGGTRTPRSGACRCPSSPVRAEAGRS